MLGDGRPCPRLHDDHRTQRHRSAGWTSKVRSVGAMTATTRVPSRGSIGRVCGSDHLRQPFGGAGDYVGQPLHGCGDRPQRLGLGPAVGRSVPGPARCSIRAHRRTRGHPVRGVGGSMPSRRESVTALWVGGAGATEAKPPLIPPQPAALAAVRADPDLMGAAVAALQFTAPHAGHLTAARLRQRPAQRPWKRHGGSAAIPAHLLTSPPTARMARQSGAWSGRATGTPLSGRAGRGGAPDRSHFSAAPEELAGGITDGADSSGEYAGPPCTPRLFRPHVTAFCRWVRRVDRGE
jgi:hypothetical protein